MDAEVLVLQHTLEDGPGYLGQWLDAQGLRWHAPCAEAGHVYPESVRGHRALAVLGGAWSANDDRPSLRHAEHLIREADALGIPVIGHCLGGQLLARALGGQVQTLPEPEIGWLHIAVNAEADAQAWLGPPGAAMVYQWHYDSFVVLPPGARALASSTACVHQAFALRPRRVDDGDSHRCRRRTNAGCGCVAPGALIAGCGCVAAGSLVAALGRAPACQAADQCGGHVAAAEEGDVHVSLRRKCRGRRPQASRVSR